jgi:hypothetical protein
LRPRYNIVPASAINVACGSFEKINVPGRGDDDASLIEPIEAIFAGSLT